MKARGHRTAGFTLVEVLVALAVLAITMIALLGKTSQSLRTTSDLRDRTLASWVAMNVIAEQRIGGSWPEKGESDGEMEMGGGDWHWSLEVSETQDPDLRRLTVRVRPENREQGSLVTMYGFMGRPLPPTRLGEQAPPPPGEMPEQAPPPDKNPKPGARR